MLINNATYQRETLSERPIRQPLNTVLINYTSICQLEQCDLQITHAALLQSLTLIPILKWSLVTQHISTLLDMTLSLMVAHIFSHKLKKKKKKKKIGVSALHNIKYAITLGCVMSVLKVR